MATASTDIPVAIASASTAKHTGTTAELPALPPNFPAHLDSPLAWSGAQFQDESEYVYTLSTSEITEANGALAHFNGLGLNGDMASPETFPLPTLGPVLQDLSREIHDGKGVHVIRGIKPEDYSVEDLTTMYMGLQSYVADQYGRQDKRGNMLVHIVADSSTKEAVEHHRHSTRAITFHNEEAGDIISWLTRSTANTGGKCIISSAYNVYNVLAATRPDLVRMLARSDWPFAFPKFHCRPVIFYQNGKFMMNFGRAPLLGNATHPRPAHLPSLNARQIEALDAIESIARATEVEIKTQAGDIHFINNLAILHRREGFVNGQSATEKRHLVRMRIRSTEHGWDIPTELKPEWERAFRKQGPRHWHLQHLPSFFFPLRSAPN